MTRRQPILSTLAGLAVALLGGAAAADDTEIFTQVLPPVDPNILFVIDTSGSMESEVVVGQDYDPTVMYSGECKKDHIYYTHSTTNVIELPRCDGDMEPDTHVNLDAFRCRAALDAIAQVGFFLDSYAQWDPNNSDWRLLVRAETGTPPGGERLVECAADYGIHGDGVDEQKVYPADGDSGPWNAAPTLSIDWPAFDNYTFYSANYLNWISSSPQEVVQSRLDLVKDVVGDLIIGMNGARVGIARFSSDGQGGMVLHEIADVATARDSLLSVLAAQTPAGATPLAETMFEMHQYLRGAEVVYGKSSQPVPSTPASMSDDNYISPIAEQCQRSFIVLLSDGLPVEDTDARARIEGLPGFAEATGSPTCSESCLDELARYLAETDLGAVDGEQNALTYTIGVGTDLQLLEATATALKPDGTPAYYAVADFTGLMDAFTEILTDIEAEATTFAAPAVPVNSFNRATNLDEVYFTLFVPSGAPHWAGNVKKYRLGNVEDGSLQILDADGNLAVDATTGTFLEGARSLWSAEPDPDPLEGGIRGRMSTERTIYTDSAGLGNDVPLAASVNRFHEDNEAITAAMLGVPEERRTEAIRFLRGIGPDGTAQPILGDSLHSVPLVVSYGGTEADPDLALFFMTNDGYFHAIDPNPAGENEDLEQFAFIPNELLGQLGGLLDNVPQNPVRKAYGLDGPLTYWIKNDDGDGIVEAGNGERLFVYFGMRRGGRNYYALDLTHRSDPRLAWTIRGGTGDFEELGQTWSAATVAEVGIDGSPRTVLVFGGGYDTRQDEGGPHLDDGVGRALYVVDAETGERLWWAANLEDHGTADLPLAEMTNSIPSDVRVIDTNADGFADRFYVGDMGGRVWRFDIDNASNANHQLAITGAVFASVGGADEAGNRRFYYPPSVAQIIDPRVGSFLTVSIGSGHRAHPLGTGVADRFYMFRDLNVFTPPRNQSGQVAYPAPLTEGSLLDVTENLTPTIDALNEHPGWMIRLTGGGEKVLASALTADSKVFFTTYLPTVVQEPTCNLAGVIGSGRLYSVQLLTGAPVIYSDVMTPDDRYEELARGGIPPAPVPIFTLPPCQGEDCGGGGDGGPEPPVPPTDPGGGSCTNPFSQVTLLVATEAHDPRICNAPQRTYWRQVGTAR